LETSDRAIGNALSVALIEVVGPKILVSAAVTQHPIRSDQNGVRDRDASSLATTPRCDASVLRG
jgi:hypothetical protein